MVKIETQMELSKYIMENLTEDHITCSGKFILLAIAHHVNAEHNWSGYPSVERLQRFTCLKRSTVFTALKELKEKLFITYVSGSNVGGNNICNLYTVNVDAISKAVGVEAIYSLPPTNKKDVAPKKETKYIYNDGEDDEDFPPFYREDDE